MHVLTDPSWNRYWARCANIELPHSRLSTLILSSIRSYQSSRTCQGRDEIIKRTNRERRDERRGWEEGADTLEDDVGHGPR